MLKIQHSFSAILLKYNVLVNVKKNNVIITLKNSCIFEIKDITS